MKPNAEDRGSDAFGGSVVAATAGAVRADGPPLSAEELRELAEIAIAEDVMQRMGD